MIKILVEGMTNNKGGKESYIINTYNKFDKDKYSFTFVAYDKEIAYEDFLLKTGAQIIHLPSRSQGLFRFRKSLSHLFETNEYDVLWAHKTTLSSCEIMEFAKKNNVPLRIIHSHCSSNMGGKLTYILHQINKRKIKNWANAYFACSDVASQWFFGNEKSNIMKNGIDVEKFRFNPLTREKIRKELKIDDCFVVGHVGRFGVEKNHKKLIDVFYELSKLDNNTCLVLCGDGEERPNIEAYIKEKGLNDKVILLGVVNNVNEILQAIDIIVMPSLFEGLPFALLEAQAAGLKCVVSDTVSRESDILGWNTFLSLTLDDREWAKTIIDTTSGNREEAADIITSNGFDIDSCVKRLQLIIESNVSGNHN